MKSSGVKVLSLLLSLCLSVSYSLNSQIEIDLSSAEQLRIDRGEIIVRELETNEKPGQTLEAVGLVRASRRSTKEAIIDFENYHEFMPNVRRVERLTADDTSAVLNYYLDLPLGIEQRYRIEICWTDIDSISSRVEWNSIEWPGLKPLETIRETRGFWLIKDQGNNTSLILYHVYTDPGPIPFGFGWIVDFMMEQSLPKVLLQTKARVESPGK